VLRTYQLFTRPERKGLVRDGRSPTSLANNPLMTLRPGQRAPGIQAALYARVKPSRDQRIGMVRVGSQCDVFLRRVPTLDVLCQPGDRVRAGETILARY